MSQRGWQEFLVADGVEDWVVLHGGATAVFRSGSLGEAARLAEAFAHVADLEGSGAAAHNFGCLGHGPFDPRPLGTRAAAR